MKQTNGCRESALTFSFDFVSSLLPGRAIHVLFLIIPAFVISCHKGENPSSALEVSPRHEISVKTLAGLKQSIIRTDVFVYEDSPAGRIDCWQNFGEDDDGVYEVSSCSGGKTMVMLCNSPMEEYGFKDICSITAMKNLRFRLEDDNPGNPVMVCLERVEAGKSLTMYPKPIMSEIYLRSISCDFSQKPYRGRTLTDVKAYLVNVNSEWCLADENGASPERIVNSGCVWEIGEVGPAVTYPGLSMYCYPNSAPEESIGTPFTRLVIEGKIDGDTYWYPIEINRESSGCGVERNRRYVYDISIRRAGLCSPAGKISEAAVNIRMEVVRWEEKDWYDVMF